MRPRKLQALIVYSSRDTEIVTEFRQDWLKILENRNEIQVWYAAEMSAGAEWDQEIRKNLDRADIIMLFISATFLASDYIRTVELKKSIERHHRREVRLIPVILSPCPWRSEPSLKGINALPPRGEPISQWKDRTAAFEKVFEGTVNVIADRRGALSLPVADNVTRVLPADPPASLPRPENPPKIDGEFPITEYIDVQSSRVDRELNRNVLVDTIHAGDYFPAELSEKISEADILEAFREEKDWGANQVAFHLARELGLQSFLRINLARAALDYGRYPGSTTADSHSLSSRLAINAPLGPVLSYTEKENLLRSYDRISDEFENAVKGKRVKLGIHTYDRYNPGPIHSERTERPQVSIVYTSEAYHLNTRVPFGYFDPLYIHELSEYTADLRLTARIALTLENSGLHVAVNHPYTLPAGSVEERAHAFSYFNYLKSNFGAQIEELIREEDPSLLEGDGLRLVWSMLKDTNLRDADSEILRSYIHMYRQPPRGYEETCRSAQRIYDIFHAFIDDHRRSIREDFQRRDGRLSAVAVEVRKDLVWRGEDGGENEIKHDEVRAIAKLLAEAVRTYFKEDLPG